MLKWECLEALLGFRNKGINSFSRTITGIHHHHSISEGIKSSYKILFCDLGWTQIKRMKCNFSIYISRRTLGWFLGCYANECAGKSQTGWSEIDICEEAFSNYVRVINLLSYDKITALEWESMKVELVGIYDIYLILSAITEALFNSTTVPACRWLAKPPRVHTLFQQLYWAVNRTCTASPLSNKC